MSFYGDLASIGLGDLLQNLEQARRSGTLTMSKNGAETLLHIEEGRVALLRAPGRPPLVEALVLHGVVSADQLAAARGRRRGTRRSIGECLVAAGVVDDVALVGAAESILTEDLCTLLIQAEGSFRFREGGPPPRIFDPEERRLDLRVSLQPVLLEAARRRDHWEMVRRVIPSDSMHLVAIDPEHVPDSIESPELARELMARLDGSTSVAEVVGPEGPRSFLAHCVLAQLVKERAVRAVEAADLAQLAGLLRSSDPARALEIVSRARETEPRNPALLELEVGLCEELGDERRAASAAKLLAHLHLERGESEVGRALLEKATRLDPEDTAVRERSLHLAIEEGRVEEAIEQGLALVELYRAPGLHARASEVLLLLRELRPADPDLAQEWARSQTEAGDPRTAVVELLRLGKAAVGRADDGGALALFLAALEIEPSNETALRYREQLEADRFRLRRQRGRLLRRRLAAAAAVALGLTLGWVEMRARWDVAEASTEISRSRWIEEERYERAHQRLQEIADRYWFTPTRHLELRVQLKNLEERIAERAPGPGEAPAEPAAREE
ncbi:MAG: DUF4388 domain-containing protein [Planctomycetota bacterium]